MLDLRRFPVSDGQISYRYTFCVILDRNEIFKIPNYEFFTSGHVTPRRHGNVGNRLADRMEALSKSCGASLRSKSPSEEPKLRFSP